MMVIGREKERKGFSEQVNQVVEASERRKVNFMMRFKKFHVSGEK